MFKKPEEVHLTKEETEGYGKAIDAKNAQHENVSMSAAQEEPTHDIPPPLSEEEIKKRVGEQNFKNAKDNTIQGSINS